MGCYTGLKADNLLIDYNNEIIEIGDVIIGIYEKKIGRNYSALIGLELLEGGKENEDIMWGDICRVM